MAANFIHRVFLTDRHAQFLSIFILLAIFVLPFRDLYASSDVFGYPPSTVMVFGQPTDNTPLASEERHQRLTQLLDYVRKEGRSWLPGLLPTVGNPMAWARTNLGIEMGMSGMKNVHNQSLIGEDQPQSLLQPVSDLMGPALTEEEQSLWLSSQYHHKGFLPTHDAVMMGFAMHNHVWRDVQFDIHPFYGQNWMGATGYWGTEMAMDIGAGSVGAQQKPWGKIALRYSNGDHELMDSNHGFDMHGEVNFTENIGLNAGVRENNSSELGNYIMVRWKLVGN